MSYEIRPFLPPPPDAPTCTVCGMPLTLQVISESSEDPTGEELSVPLPILGPDLNSGLSAFSLKLDRGVELPFHRSCWLQFVGRVSAVLPGAPGGDRRRPGPVH
jgi:hypothetical protein